MAQPQTDGKYVIIYRFDIYAHCPTWEESALRRQRLAQLEGVVEGEEDIKSVTGLEFWFDLPRVPAAAKPSPHKMALTLVVYLMLGLVQWLLSPLTGDLPAPVALFVVVTVQVALLTYVVMPRVTQQLKGWLYA